MSFARIWEKERSVLELRDVVCCYGQVAALKGVSLTVGKGELVALIGANGAGKTTTLKAISGLLHPTAGMIVFDGHDITHASARTILSLGLAHCPEGRHVFPDMTVLENLEMGCYLRTDRREVAADMMRVFDQFPRLAERRQQPAGTLSGGEQQMLCIGRALMARPRLLLLDEPSLGLAPMLVKQIFGAIVEINRDQGVTILLVEQNAYQALRIARRGYVLATGQVVMEGAGAELLANPEIRAAYLECGH
jgi:branched-chain amino acid transport system ATP-binding protein